VLARATTFAVQGVDAVEVVAEADINSGLPAFTIVGLADVAVQESRERVRSALINSQLEFPLRRITVNLAPADLRKAGPGFDLALAAALLGASGQIPDDRLEGVALCGELGLDGSVRPVRGALAIASAAQGAGVRCLVVPLENEPEATLVEDLPVAGIATLGELVRLLSGGERRAPRKVDAQALLRTIPDDDIDMSQVRGHDGVKRALEVAAAGGHNLLMVGAPGSGKSMLARRLPTILPPLSMNEALESTRIHSVAGLLGDRPLVARRPFRAPHHTISSAGLVGGGPGPSAGEISLAHNGVLFLDELSEFSRPALEALRQPLEEGHVHITRSQRCVRFPARFMLVGATNPCPCGYAGDAHRECSCHPGAVDRYKMKLSGPLLDRVDLLLRVEPPPLGDLPPAHNQQGSEQMRERVAAARLLQTERLAGHAASCNAELGSRMLHSVCTLEKDARPVLVAATGRMGLSMRGHDRVLRVARTIADLCGSREIARPHLTEALGYRDHRRGARVVTAQA